MLTQTDLKDLWGQREKRQRKYDRTWRQRQNTQDFVGSIQGLIFIFIDTENP